MLWKKDINVKKKKKSAWKEVDFSYSSIQYYKKGFRSVGPWSTVEVSLLGAFLQVMQNVFSIYGLLCRFSHTNLAVQIGLHLLFNYFLALSWYMAAFTVVPAKPLLLTRRTSTLETGIFVLCISLLAR